MINCFKCSKGTTIALTHIEHHKCYIVSNVQGPCGTNNALNLNHIEKIKFCFKLPPMLKRQMVDGKQFFPKNLKGQNTQVGKKKIGSIMKVNLTKQTQWQVSYLIKVCKQKKKLDCKLLAKKTQVYINYSSKVCHYGSEYSNLHTNHTLNI